MDDGKNVCRFCGACCREAYDSVPVTDEDEARLKGLPGIVHRHDDGWKDLRRVPSDLVPRHAEVGTRCVALAGNGSEADPYDCVIYEFRPTNCRELEIGSEGCLTARERVGLPPLDAAPGEPA